ncbi:hypothetical protein MLGJGCBP_00974 [Rhodococcus sp. T7]|nr:hypothetical protein MLGJGCBP_00974 [Rhodococcus sp. T7]
MPSTAFGPHGRGQGTCRGPGPRGSGAVPARAAGDGPAVRAPPHRHRSGSGHHADGPTVPRDAVSPVRLARCHDPPHRTPELGRYAEYGDRVGRGARGGPPGRGRAPRRETGERPADRIRRRAVGRFRDRPNSGGLRDRYRCDHRFARVHRPRGPRRAEPHPRVGRLQPGCEFVLRADRARRVRTPQRRTARRPVRADHHRAGTGLAGSGHSRCGDGGDRTRHGRRTHGAATHGGGVRGRAARRSDPGRSACRGRPATPRARRGVRGLAEIGVRAGRASRRHATDAACAADSGDEVPATHRTEGPGAAGTAARGLAGREAASAGAHPCARRIRQVHPRGPVAGCSSREAR